MLRGILIFVSALVALTASLHQFWFKEFMAVTLGVGREMQTLEEFPYECRRLQHERLEACEDLWLDDEARVLYAACAGTDHRLSWNQARGQLKIAGRRAGGSELIAMDIDDSGSDGLFNSRAIRPVGYDGAMGDSSLDLFGFDAEVIDEERIYFYLVNQRPPVDIEKQPLNTAMIGDNATIEVFELQRGDDQMKHLMTVWSSEVWSPSRPAAVGHGSFLITNDHSAKIGLRKHFDAIAGGGNVAYCASSGKCHPATATGLKFPNGLAKGGDDLIYVPSSISGQVHVFQLQPNRTLSLVDAINVGMPTDSIGFDAAEDMYVTATPSLVELQKHLGNPRVTGSPSTIFRIRKSESGYEVKKVIEDGEGRTLSGVSSVRHDARTGRLFFGALVAPYMMVCDPK